MDGKFISFEGPDGAGKTSVMRQITADLKEQLGSDGVVYTREPGGNHIAEQIRDVLFDADNTDMDPRTEALLFAAARRQHLVADILPALQNGKVILCDRYVDSSIAYQGAGRGLGEENIWQINQFAIDGLMPELTIYLDIDSELGLQRIAQNRADEVNRLDEEKLSFHRKVRSAYQKLAQENPQRIVTIDASQPLDQVILQVQQAIHQRFSQLF
ncbi:dTMP kinase [Limosilactobacillus mucosae]|uniref:Thymidylate kinase n=1 Tax=Limosilactobacillus mucosae TaxID=97478 RepID=A0AAJ1HTI9_LIMMU|nr:dTMP kinase [Limosilactobacillus mucosae]MDD6454201.1 dTMP kinase [Lactobacillus sp.]MDC2829262.1 dTMP kinase [Limosilactobacillus mucosae]MDC2836945.1 dTMP kinase [Limosilactobacillus mucosae]MDC2839082.1 dTMP kinase [Limosilactobacillus mucosae]MDC2845407.1 dTMP kinase [Limosilactobacillus mucosae]